MQVLVPEELEQELVAPMQQSIQPPQQLVPEPAQQQQVTDLAQPHHSSPSATTNSQLAAMKLLLAIKARNLSLNDLFIQFIFLTCTSFEYYR